MRFLILALILSLATSVLHPVAADTVPSTDSTLHVLHPTLDMPNTGPVYIRSIEIHGNDVTRLEVLERYITFDIGQILDTLQFRATRSNLLATFLYDEIDIVVVINGDEAHISIKLKETVRLQIGYGLTYITRRYGDDKLWFKLSGDVKLENFRGRMEEIMFGASVWDYWGVNLGWYKPFLSMPYYITTSAGVAMYPDENLPLDYIDVYARATIGRRLGRRWRLAFGVSPIYRHRMIVESELDGSLALDLSQYPESDPAPPPESVGNRPDDGAVFELFTQLSLAADYRSSRFDPQSGWLMSSSARTNSLYSGDYTPFTQFVNEFRYYQPSLLNGLAVLRLRHTVRNVAADSYHRLTYGGAGEVRGYGDKYLGAREFSVNSAVLASLKYHQPIWKTPPIPVSLINLIFSGVDRLTCRIDATFIADYARLFEEPLGAITLDGRWQEGIGLGGGVRFVVPEIRQSGCIDVVWGRHEGLDGVTWEPMVHIYLDLFF
ncbi:MAG: BamA/TamA family outer membrane protein [Chitinispirillales bacterium]|jgi:outer membrane protein assembly factor BamA|nr:BamA/TamA family outer membrane protein [Chitinispirillales bacterium]